MRVAWNRLIRFVATDGRNLSGEPILPLEDFDLGHVTEKDKLTAKVIKGKDLYGDSQVSDEVVTVKKLLGPLAAEDVPILRCVGLNYAKHSEFVLPSLPTSPCFLYATIFYPFSLKLAVTISPD